MKDRTREGPDGRDPKMSDLTPDDFATLDPRALLQEMQETTRRLDAAYAQLEASHQQNERLVAALTAAKEQLAALRAEVDKLAAPPNSYGTVLQAHPEGTADVWTGGRKLKVTLAPGVAAETLQRGQEVLLNEARNV